MKTFGCAATDRLRSSRVKRVVALALAAGALLLVSTCTTKTDWTKFDRETIEASVMSLNEANRMYYELKPASGKAEAAQQAIDYLLTQLAVDTAGMAPDSSVWVFFTNGAVGTTFPERPDSGPGCGLGVASERTPEVAALGGGEAPGPYTVLAPFHTEFGFRDFSDEIIRMLKECLGPDVAVKDCFDEEVTVEAIRSAMGSGLLYWSGHGATVPKTRDGTDFVTGLLAGEHHGPGAFGDRAIALEAAGFWFANPPVGVPGRHLFWLADEGQIFVGILPGFVSDFGLFDRPEGMTARDKCIVYISCCDGSVMGPAFSAEGVDAFFGYSGSMPGSLTGTSSS